MRLRGLAILTLAGVAVAAPPDWYYADIETVRGLSTKKLFYLEQKAGLCPTPRDEPESLNVRMVGKWGGGPSWGVTGRDTLVCLSRGSEVVVINFADTANPRVLSYIQARRLAGRPVLQGNRLYLATSGYIEVFDITDPTNVPRIGRLATPVSDIDVEDTLVYAIGADSFKVFSFADPQNPRLLGACVDSGYALDVDRGYAYLCDRWGMYILDATNPASPHRVASWGTDIAGVKVRGNHCYVTQGSMGSNSLHVLNVSNPASPWQEGVLSGLSGEDIYLVDTFAFLPGFDVVNIADSSRPRLVATTSVGGPRLSVWTDESLRLGFVAVNYVGLHVLNLADVSNPRLDTTLLPLGDLVGISVRNGIACVAAQSGTGLTLLDVSDPANIRELANLDTAGGGPSSGAVVNCESLAYIGWAAGTSIGLRVVDISDPSAPHFVGVANGFNPVRAIAMKDSIVYCAEDYKFEVFSVANPRQPAWMGRCNLQEASSDVAVRDSLAYVACLPSSVVRIADPAHPTVIGSFGFGALGVAVNDTFAYQAVNFDGLEIWTIANPRSPHLLDTVGYSRGFDVEVKGSLLHYGGSDYRVLDLSQPRRPPELGFYATPYYVFGVATDSSLVYCACPMAGVIVLEYLPQGVEDDPLPRAAVSHAPVTPNPSRRECHVLLGQNRPIGLFSVAGRSVLVDVRESVQADGTRVLRLQMGSLSPGAYFLRLTDGRRHEVVKIIKQ